MLNDRKSFRSWQSGKTHESSKCECEKLQIECECRLLAWSEKVSQTQTVK